MVDVTIVGAKGGPRAIAEQDTVSRRVDMVVGDKNTKESIEWRNSIRNRDFARLPAIGQ